MFLNSKEIGELDEGKLIEFLERKIQEFHCLDYKEQLSGNGEDNQKISFLKQITGFANAAGGNLIIGVKEPRGDLKATEQIVGVDNGVKLAKTLESIAKDNVDPPIAGFLVLPVKLTNEKHVIVAHSPPSQARPHMVSYKKHKSFYIRHSESTSPMTTHEIKDSVISSMSAQGRINEYLNYQEHELMAYEIGSKNSVLFMQAIPIIEMATQWDVSTADIQNVLCGHEGRNKKFHDGYDLRVLNPPIPTVNGIRGVDEGRHISEVHRNGYFSSLFITPKENVPGQVPSPTLFGQNMKPLFEAFCSIGSELADTTGGDYPMLFRCKILNAKGTFLYHPQRVGTRAFIGPLGKPEVRFPDQVRSVGEDFDGIADEWHKNLYNAFGKWDR